MIYPRYIVWPNEDGHETVSSALDTKHTILSYWQQNKNLDDCSDDDRLLTALFLFHIDPTKLHPTDAIEADVIIDMAFGNEIEDAWLKKQAGSPRDYKHLKMLLNNDKVRFLDFIGVSTIHMLLKKRAETILEPLIVNNNLIAISNLLFIRDVTFFDDAPYLMNKAAKLGDPVSMWATAHSLYRRDNGNVQLVLALWHKLANGETHLPYKHLDDITWDAKNNLKWIENNRKDSQMVTTENIDLPF